MKILLLILSLSTLVSCGNPSEIWPDPSANKTVYKVEPAEAEAYSYELRTDSCSTGKHSFGSFDNACKALNDNELNKECALSEREELFNNSQCVGNFTSV
jgi:hypothetical protein